MPVLDTRASIAAAIRESLASRADWLIVAGTRTGRVAIARAGVSLLLSGIPASAMRFFRFASLDPRTGVVTNADGLLIPKANLGADQVRAALTLVGARDIPAIDGTRDLFVLDWGPQGERVALLLEAIATGGATPLCSDRGRQTPKERRSPRRRNRSAKGGRRRR